MKKLFSIFLLVILSWAAMAQNRTVTGTVSDESGDPMPGATLVAGKNYAIADDKGRSASAPSRRLTSREDASSRVQPLRRWMSSRLA